MRPGRKRQSGTQEAHGTRVAGLCKHRGVHTAARAGDTACRRMQPAWQPCMAATLLCIAAARAAHRHRQEARHAGLAAFDAHPRARNRHAAAHPAAAAASASAFAAARGAGHSAVAAAGTADTPSTAAAALRAEAAQVLLESPARRRAACRCCCCAEMPCRAVLLARRRPPHPLLLIPGEPGLLLSPDRQELDLVRAVGWAAFRPELAWSQRCRGTAQVSTGCFAKKTRLQLGPRLTNVSRRLHWHAGRCCRRCDRGGRR